MMELQTAGAIALIVAVAFTVSLALSLLVRKR